MVFERKLNKIYFNAGLQLIAIFIIGFYTNTGATLGFFNDSGCHRFSDVVSVFNSRRGPSEALRTRNVEPHVGCHVFLDNTMPALLLKARIILRLRFARLSQRLQFGAYSLVVKCNFY